MITVSLVTEINCKNKLPGKCQKSGKNPRAEQLNSFPGSFQAGAEMMRPFLAGLNLGRWELGSHHRSNLVEKSCVRNNEEDTDRHKDGKREADDVQVPALLKVCYTSKQISLLDPSFF